MSSDWFDRIEFVDSDNGNNFYISTTNTSIETTPQVVAGGSGSVPLTRNDAIRVVNLLLRFIQEVPDREEKEDDSKVSEKVVDMARWLKAREDEQSTDGHNGPDTTPPTG